MALKFFEKNGKNENIPDFSFYTPIKKGGNVSDLKEIVNMFKVNMLPEYAGNDVHGRSLIIPNTFNIKYMYAGQENSFLHKIGECACTSMNVTYGGERYKTHAAVDGGAPPIQTNLSLTFTEQEFQTKTTIQRGM